MNSLAFPGSTGRMSVRVYIRKQDNKREEKLRLSGNGCMGLVHDSSNTFVSESQCGYGRFTAKLDF